MTDYYKHTYSQRDIDLIRGDLMQRITELTTERDALVEAVMNVEKVYLCNDPGTLAEAIDRAVELAQFKEQPND